MPKVPGKLNFLFSGIYGTRNNYFSAVMVPEIISYMHCKLQSKVKERLCFGESVLILNKTEVKFS